MDFSDKVILITGGTSGIGAATAISFIEHNAKIVYVCGRTTLKWEISKVLFESKLCDNANRIVFIQTDIRVESQVRNLIKTIFSNHGQLDICFNNVGVITPPNFIWNTDFGFSEKIGDYIYYKIYAGSEDKYKQTPIITNLYGTSICLKWELYYILKYNNPKKQVNIVNMASSVSNIGLIGYSTYTASKGGIVTLTKNVAGEVANFRALNKDKVPIILVNSISPGYVMSPVFLDSVTPNIPLDKILDNVVKTIPLGYIEDPSKITIPILILASDKLTTYMTGSDVYVDGGVTSILNYSSS